MVSRKSLAHALAVAMLCGCLSRAALVNRAAAVLGRRPAWLRGLAARIVKQFGRGTRPRCFRLERVILNDPGFLKAARGSFGTLASYRFRPKMCPAAGPPRQWELPPIRTPGELAVKLNLRPNELAWFADCRMLESKLPEGPLRHYRYRWQRKRDGSARLIESPKQHLKTLQRYLLREILNQIPPHPSAHGFRQQHSIRTFAAPHVAQKMVLKLDLTDFFPSVLRARVLGIFLTAGYPEAVAELLTGLCTNSVPRGVIRSCPDCSSFQEMQRLKQLYHRPHLPQGAPTSPILANLAAYRLDCRLAGLAKAVGAVYTRYADDLVLSGGDGFRRIIQRFYIGACAIALEEGFQVHTRKTRIMGQSVSQRTAGIVLNQHLNTPRAEYDVLKAITHNCVTRGASGQNRSGVADFRAHLAGRIAHLEMLNPARGQKLRAAFEKISW